MASCLQFTLQLLLPQKYADKLFYQHRPRPLEKFKRVFGSQMPRADSQALASMYTAMRMQDDWISDWESIGHATGMSPSRDADFWERVSRRAYSLLAKHHLGKLAHASTEISLLYTKHTYPRSSSRSTAPDECQVTYEMLATASIWVLDMLFDDSRDLFDGAEPVRRVIDGVLGWFDGLSSEDKRVPSVVSTNRRVQALFEELCMFMRLIYNQAGEHLSTAALHVTLSEYRVQIETTAKETLDSFETPEPATVSEYLKTRVLSCGYTWNIHTRVYLVAEERGLGEHSDALEEFWNSEPVLRASRLAAEYCSLIDDVFSFVSDYEHGVRTPVKILGERALPNGSESEQQQAGAYGTIEIIDSMLDKMVTVLSNVPVRTPLEEKFVDILVSTTLYVCFGATQFYISSPRYNKDICRKYIDEKLHGEAPLTVSG